MSQQKKCPLSKDVQEDRENYIVWLDLEFTNYIIETEFILEIACIITDKNINIVSEEFNVVIHQPDDILKNLNDWCNKTFTKNGLIEECQASKISLKDAEEMLLNFLKKHVPEKTCPLAGNSVGTDQMLLQKHMSSVTDYLHYRVIDVSSIKELVRRWKPEIYENVPPKQLLHRALPDIKESIEELKYYKKHIFLVS